MKKVSIHFDPLSNVSLCGDGWSIKSRPGHDFWRVFIDTGENHELSVYSHEQSIAYKSESDGCAVYRYDQLVAEDGQVFDITLELNIKEENGHLVFTSSIENHSEAILNELQYPFISSDNFGCDPSEEILYVPEGLGARIQNPRSRVASTHTEYTSADYKSTWMTFAYPDTYGVRPLSMPWMGLQCGKKYFRTL